MKEWRQTIAFICTVVVTLVTLATLMLSQFASMRAEHADIRMEMRAGFVDTRMEMRAGFDTVRAQARIEQAATLEELAAIRDQLNSVDRRTARIEGSLSGIEIAPEPPDGE